MKYLWRFARKASFFTNCRPTVRANSSMMMRHLKSNGEMVTSDLLSDEDDFEAARTLFLYSRARGDFFEERRTSLTPEQEREAEHEAALALIQLSKTHPNQHNKRVKANKSQLDEEVKLAGQAVDEEPEKKDNSDETLRFLLQWNKTKPVKPPFLRELNVVGVCSRPMRKQLTESDVKGSQVRLMLGKKHVKRMMLQVMGDSQMVVGTDGVEVWVYGPDGVVRKMLFKMWSGGVAPVLTSPEWNNFVQDYELKMHCDFLTIWMFRHRESPQICFAIDFTRFPLEKPLSRRIINAVFDRV